MKLYMDVELRFDGRCGVEARSPDLRLTSHGLDESEALQSLHRGVVAWCEGLRLIGKFEKVLREKGLHWEGNGESVLVELHPVNSRVNS